MTLKHGGSSSLFSRSFFGKVSFSKKAQIHAQIFIYVVAIVLFSFIMLYGYNAIRGFKEKSEQINFIKFKTDLTSTIKRVAPDYGTLKREELFIGGVYQDVCFVQSYKMQDNLVYISGNISNPLIKDSFDSGTDKNVFLITNTLQESFDVGPINMSGGYICAPVLNGKVKIQFGGRGDHAFISTY
jgi:hypothetical protein